MCIHMEKLVACFIVGLLLSIYLQAFQILCARVYEYG